MNNTYVLASVGAVIVIAVLMWLSRKNSAKDTFTGNVDSGAQTELPPTGSNAQTEASMMARVMQAAEQRVIKSALGNVADEVRALIDSGKKIEAIQRVREHTGLGLKEAKDLVEALERGAAVSIHAHAPTPENISDIDGAARKLVAAGKLIEAVKLVRDQKNLGLQEAKAYVERL